MKKVRYLLLLFIIMFMPSIVNANTIKNTCWYSSDDIDLKIQIYSDDDKVSSNATIYKFGDKTWERGKASTGFLNALKISVENYGEPYTKAGYTLDQYEDAKNYSCPRYIFVEDDTFFSAYVSNELNDLKNFKTAAFNNEERAYFGTYTEDVKEEIDNVDKKCLYTDSAGNLNSVLTIYENGDIYGVATKFYTNQTFLSQKPKNVKDFTYNGECPEYMMIQWWATGNGEYYISDSKSELESIAAEENWLYTNPYNMDVSDRTGKDFVLIGGVSDTSTSNLNNTKSCIYNDEIKNCENCEIEIIFYNPSASSEIFSNINIKSGDIESILTKEDYGWSKTTFNNIYRNYLPSFCPSDLVFDYDKSTKTLKIYINEYYYKNAPKDENNIHDIGEIDNCQSLLGDPDEDDPPTPAYYMSVIFSVIRYVAIILLIVLTIMDFVGAVASQDNDILKKAASKAIKRAILCVIVFLLPILVDFVLQFIHDSSIGDCIN